MTDQTLRILPPTTAAIHPERFPEELTFLTSRRVTAIIVVLLVVAAFCFRMCHLGSESFGEDEFNKLQTVEDYRQNGLSGKNGEHPFLMKGLQMVSVSAADRLNSTVLSPASAISPEAALRFPIALFGTFTTLLLFFLVRELFGRSIALTSAALWAVEPISIGFDRVAKEDSLVLFFFLLTNLLWIRSQTLAERGDAHWIRYAWGTAAAFAALMASKYNPWLLTIPAAYYTIYDRMQDIRKWAVGRPRWLIYFAILAVVFVILNPTIVLPDTWREMRIFSSESRIGHDSYEFMGHLYPNRMSLWLSGMPPSFYYVFLAVKTSLTTLILFVVGLPLLFRRRLGDGRFFIFFWAFIWFVPFTFLGGKFTRYFAVPEPLLLISAAVAFCFGVRWLSAKMKLVGGTAVALQAMLFVALLVVPVYDSISVGPHFRLFTNTIGGGMAKAGTYFPHDEFYDAGAAETVAAIGDTAPAGATVACETPGLFEYYAGRMGRRGLRFVSLSDKQAVSGLRTGDVVVLISGRRYFSNDGYEKAFSTVPPDAVIRTAGVVADRVYKLDNVKLSLVLAAATQ